MIHMNLSPFIYYCNYSTLKSIAFTACDSAPLNFVLG